MPLPDAVDFVTNNVLLPIVALSTCIMLTRFVGLQTVTEEISLSGKFKGRALFSAVIRVLAPICLVVILLWAILGVVTPFELFQL